jgi:hypothetical protein
MGGAEVRLGTTTGDVGTPSSARTSWTPEATGAAGDASWTSGAASPSSGSSGVAAQPELTTRAAHHAATR